MIVAKKLTFPKIWKYLGTLVFILNVYKWYLHTFEKVLKTYHGTIMLFGCVPWFLPWSTIIPWYLNFIWYYHCTPMVLFVRACKVLQKISWYCYHSTCPLKHSITEVNIQIFLNILFFAKNTMVLWYIPWYYWISIYNGYKKSTEKTMELPWNTIL